MCVTETIVLVLPTGSKGILSGESFQGLKSSQMRFNNARSTFGCRFVLNKVLIRNYNPQAQDLIHKALITMGTKNTKSFSIHFNHRELVHIYNACVKEFIPLQPVCPHLAAVKMVSGINGDPMG